MMREDHTLVCRICQVDDERSNLIAPCKCKGSVKFVHPSCLDQWRLSSNNPKNYFYCEICKEKYLLTKHFSDAYGDHQRKKLLWYYFYLTRDITAICMLVVSLVSFFGYIVHLSTDLSYIESWLYACLFGFAIFGLFSCIITLCQDNPSSDTCCDCPSSECGSCGRGGGGGGSSGGGGNCGGEAALFVFFAIVLMFALVGIGFAIYYMVQFIYYSSERHKAKLQLQVLHTQDVVQDRDYSALV